MGNLYHSTVRVFFKKQGRIKYISHLDIVRCISRAIKRSGLPVWHTLGFNPHIYLTFALPLALGYESECESMDFRLTEPVEMAQIVSRLNEVFPEGLIAYEAHPAEQKPEEIAWADYTIALEFSGVGIQEVAEQFAAWCARPEIILQKKTKKGVRELDVKPQFTVSHLDATGETLQFQMRTAAGSTLNINPTLILDAFFEEAQIKPDWMRIVRIAVLDKTLKSFV